MEGRRQCRAARHAAHSKQFWQAQHTVGGWAACQWNVGAAAKLAGAVCRVVGWQGWFGAALGVFSL